MGVKKKGAMIAICGLDGSGKTSIVDKLIGELEKRGIKTHRVKEPHIRMLTHLFRLYEDPYIDTLIFAVDRLILQRSIKEMLREGIVISERCIWDGLCYQGAAGVSWDKIMDINRADWEFKFPDLVVILDATPEQAYSRILYSTHGKVKDKWEKRDYLKKVRSEFLRLYKYRNKFPGEFQLVDSTGSLDEAYKKVKSRILRFLGLTK